MNCPLCGAHSAGKIGPERYYCGECCYEWVQKGDKISVFTITTDGDLFRINQLSKFSSIAG